MEGEAFAQDCHQDYWGAISLGVQHLVEIIFETYVDAAWTAGHVEDETVSPHKVADGAAAGNSGGIRPIANAGYGQRQ